MGKDESVSRIVERALIAQRHLSINSLIAALVRQSMRAPLSSTYRPHVDHRKWKCSEECLNAGVDQQKLAESHPAMRRGQYVGRDDIMGFYAEKDS